jgi:ABC-2 type transport system ATP-binding protein
VLILDEPTTGLDPNQLIEIRKLIQEIGQEKIVLLSTHILQEIPKICNHIIIINKGRIVENTRMQNLIKKSNNLEDHFHKLTA